MSSVSKYRAYGFTVRPINGVTDEVVKRYTEWVERQAGWYLCTEKEGSERHIHCGVYFEEPRTRGDVVKAIVRILKRGSVTDAECRVARSGVRIMYSDDFIDQYLNKDVDSVCVSMDLGIRRKDYYPTQEEQDRVQARAVDPVLQKYESLWNEWDEKEDNPSKDLVKYFCVDMWFKSRQVCVPDVKRQKGVIHNVFHYITKGEFFE